MQSNESSRWPIRLIAGILTIGILGLGAILLLLSFAFWYLLSTSEDDQTLADLHDQFVDQYIDAGYEDPISLLNDPLLKSRKILLGHDVNSRTAKDVVARLLYLNDLDSEQPIDLYVSTHGGWGDNAFTIIDTMNLIEAPVNTYAVGACYSAGTFILTAGTGQRFVSGNSIIMVHANLEDSSEKFSYEKLDRTRCEDLFRRTANLPESWYPMTFDQLYYLSPEEALKYNVVDEIIAARTVAPLP